MLRILFLILCLFSVSAFSQTQEKPKAYKFFEYEKISDNLLKEKLKVYREELLTPDEREGVIINYGKASEISRREKQISKTFPKYYAINPRINLVREKSARKNKTEIWIVPKGAKPPTPN